MVSIFAREITDNLASLVKQIDDTVGKNQDKKMAAFVVVLSDDADAVAPKLEELAAKHGIENVPLTVFDGVAGPPRYKVSKDADLTVMMWSRTKVKVNHSLAKGELDDAKIKKIVGDTQEILQ